MEKMPDAPQLSLPLKRAQMCTQFLSIILYRRVLEKKAGRKRMVSECNAICSLQDKLHFIYTLLPNSYLLVSQKVML